MSKKLSNKEFEELAERRRRERLPFLYGWNWYSWAWDFFQSTNRFNFLCAANQISKAVYIYEDVATPDGFKKMRDIQIGDEVISQSGKKTKVIDIPFFGEEKSYKITFNDGSHVICGENHEWICKGPRERFRKTYTSRWSRTKLKKMWKNPTYNKWIVKSVKDIIKHVGYTDNISPTKKYSIPVSLPVEYDEKILFDPYFVGLWIGNGSGHSITFNSDDTDLEEYCLRYGNRYNTDKVIIGFKNSFQEKIKSLNLGDYSIEKNIPSMYLFGSIEQRKNLLAGLMDTDGTCDRSGQNYSYSTTSEKLAEQVLQLVCSLGGIGRIERRKAGYKKNGEYIKCNDCFVVNMTTIFNPFKSKRKSGRWRLNTRYKHERIIESIQCVGNLKVKCITVAEDDGSFLVTNKYIVTHNSSTQIRKAIHWATEGSLWEGLWPGKTPTQFWYLYPTRPIATSEFYEKWEPEFLPRGEMKKDPKYGWDMEIKNKEVHAIHFKSGVSIYFKTYEQDVHHLQTSTVYAIFCDEELPYNLFPELRARLTATNGYYHMVFTATMGQEEWRRTIEPKSADEELFRGAFKKQVSLYDCLTYRDGTKTFWTIERIKEIEQQCVSEAEVLKRVHGKFILTGGLKCLGFERTRNVVKRFSIPSDWAIYSGVDIGSGGENSHPAAITMIAVRPDYKKGVVFKGWRGDGVVTASNDILVKHEELMTYEVPDGGGGLKKFRYVTAGQTYDWQAKDFFTIASRAGISFTPANKGREQGEQLVNTLFKLGMLVIFEGDVELEKLITEIVTLKTDTAKQVAKDDFYDSMRYCVMNIPWDFEGAAGEIIKNYVEEGFVDERSERQKHWDERRGGPEPVDDYQETLDDEMEEWQSLVDIT